MQVVVVLVVDQRKDVELVDRLTSLEFALFLELLKVWLDDFLVKLVKNPFLILRMLTEGKNEVLCGHAGCLGPSEEEGEDFVDNAIISVLEVLLDQDHGQEVASLRLIRVLFDFFAPSIDNDFAEVSEHSSITALVSLEWCDVILSKEREEDDVR